MLTPATQAARESEVFDPVAVAAELERLADLHAGKERELRFGGLPGASRPRSWKDALRSSGC